MTTWRNAGSEELLTLWRTVVGPGDRYRDKAAFSAMLERHTPVEIALAVYRLGPQLGQAWRLKSALDESDEMLDRLEVESELLNHLTRDGRERCATPFPTLSYLTYMDLRDGLGVPNAAIFTQFSKAKTTLEVFLDGFYSRPIANANATPSGTEPVKRRASQRRKPVKPADFGYLE